MSPKTGPGGTNAGGQPASPLQVLTLTGTGFKTAGNVPVADAVKVVASGSACSTGTTISVFSVVSATEIAATVPANALALGTSNAKKEYLLCVFKASGATLMASGKFTVYPRPSIIAANSPAAGGVLGANTVTVTGAPSPRPARSSSARSLLPGSRLPPMA